MGTSAGPSLAGIGRGGASNLVLEMDAHDAKSYAGEPTTNTLLNGYFPGTDTTTVTAGWINISSTAIRAFRTAEEDFFYKNLGLSNPRVVQWKGGGWYSDGGYMGLQMPNPTPGFSTSTATTVSFWYRFTGQNAAQLSNQAIRIDLDYGLADVTANYTDYNDTEWHLFSATQTSSGSYAYYNLYIYAPAYSACPGGSYFEIGAFQIEQKGYATPFVGDGQFARPASVNLMIHGNVGTGQTFSDSSPSKHTITAVADVTHSAGQSKFSGGSIYFDGNGDCLSIPDSSDWDFGGGDFTLDAWIYLSNISTYHVIMAQDDNNVQKSWQFRTQVTSGDLLFRYTTNGTTEVDIASSTTGMVINTWYHVAFVRSSDTYAFYVNGVQKGTGSLSATLHSSSAIATIGSRGDNTLPFEGYMDEARITKGTALWIAAFTPPTRRNLSAPVVDLSGTGNGGNFATKDMTDVSTYRDGQVIEPVASAVWDFDGTDDGIGGGKGCRVGNTRRKSIEAWVRGATAGTLFFMGDHGNNYKWQWTTLGGGQYMTGSGYGTRYYWSDAQLVAAGWHHWVDVVDEDQGAGDRVRRYVDGVLLTPNALTTDTGDSFYDGTDMYVDIGMADLGSGPDGLFDGEIGAIRLYKNALTWAQVKENFNQQRSRFKI